MKNADFPRSRVKARVCLIHSYPFFLQIYVVENNLEIYGRVLLLLSIAFEPKDRLGLQGEL